jgi:hypothetical protein
MSMIVAGLARIGSDDQSTKAMCLGDFYERVKGVGET